MDTRKQIHALELKAAKHQARADYARLEVTLLKEADAAARLRKTLDKLAKEVALAPTTFCPVYTAQVIVECHKEQGRITSSLINADQAVSWKHMSSTARVTSAVRIRKIRDILYDAAGVSDDIVQTCGIEDWSPIEVTLDSDDRVIGGELGWGHAQPNVANPYAEIECLGEMYTYER